jgi:hypothetical protein
MILISRGNPAIFKYHPIDDGRGFLDPKRISHCSLTPPSLRQIEGVELLRRSSEVAELVGGRSGNGKRERGERRG